MPLQAGQGGWRQRDTHRTSCSTFNLHAQVAVSTAYTPHIIWCLGIVDTDHVLMSKEDRGNITTSCTIHCSDTVVLQLTAILGGEVGRKATVTIGLQ